MARYYHTSIIPARPYKPKDKAKVENAVLVVERWILARLRHQTFFSLAQLNAAIRELLHDLNTRPFQRMPEYSRKSLFERLDKPALQPLTTRRYEYTDIKNARVNIDYHIEYDKHYYSVPDRLVRPRVEVHASRGMVVIFHKGKQVANHPRSYHKGAYSTTALHMPKQHRKHQQWTPGRLLNWAQSIGPEVLAYVRLLLQRRDHPEQGYRACLGLLSLSRDYGPGRLNAACARAMAIGGYRIKNVKNILDKGLECASIEPKQDSAVHHHENVRGAKYYH